MKKLALLSFLLCSVFQVASAQKVITNKDIVSMRNAKFSKKDIVSTMATAKCDFDLTIEGLIALKGQKISDKIIKSMFIVSPPINDSITNKDIIKLSDAGISEDIINIKIRSTPHQFDISPEALIKLKNAKVSKDIIKTMQLFPEKKKDNNPQ